MKARVAGRKNAGWESVEKEDHAFISQFLHCARYIREGARVYIYCVPEKLIISTERRHNSADATFHNDAECMR